MSLLSSSMLPLGTKAPYFELLNVTTNKVYSLNELKSEIATVIMFICNHCPYVKHVQQQLVALAEYFSNDGIKFIAISSNDVESYPEDSPNKMIETARKYSYPFPYLFDETQSVARAYHAVCTPDFYVFDNNLSLIYRGQLDDSRPGNNKPLTGNDIRTALNDYLIGNPIDTNQIPSQGCSIKWK